MDKDILYRQINPNWIVDDVVSSQAFRPMPKDHGKLSLYDGKIFTPEDSHIHFTSQTNQHTGENLKSSGVLGVTHQEFQAESLPIESDDKTFNGHMLIDYTQCSKKEIEKKAKKIRNIAVERDWLYSSNDGNSSV